MADPWNRNNRTYMAKVVRAAWTQGNLVELSDEEVGRVLGSRPQWYRGADPEMAEKFLLVMAHLTVLTEADCTWGAAWLRRYNGHLKDTPVDLLHSQQGLDKVTAYLRFPPKGAQW